MLEHLCVLSVTDSPESGTQAYNLRRPSAITRSAYPWVQLLVAGHFVFRHPRFRDPDPPPPVKFMTRLMYRRSAGPDRRHAAHSMKQMRVHPCTYHTRTYHTRSSQVSVQVLSQALATPRSLLHNFWYLGARQLGCDDVVPTQVLPRLLRRAAQGRGTPDFAPIDFAPFSAEVTPHGTDHAPG